MSARSDLLSAVRQLLIAVGGVPDAKIVHAGGTLVGAGAVGPTRPAKPYVTIRLLTPGGGTHGPAERVDSLSTGTPKTRMRERREATVSLQGYGVDAGAWLDALQLGLDSPASLAAQATAGVAAVLLTPVTDLGAMLDTAEETRFSLELILRHRYESAPATAVQLLTAEITGDAEIYDGSPNPLPVDQTITL